MTEIGPVEVEVPRNTASTFEPQIVKKRSLTGVDEIVLSLTARGLTTGEMTEWLTRPLDEVYPVIFIDALVVKVRDGQVMNRPVYVVIGVSVDGERACRKRSRRPGSSQRSRRV